MSRKLPDEKSQWQSSHKVLQAAAVMPTEILRLSVGSRQGRQEDVDAYSTGGESGRPASACEGESKDAS